MSSILTCSLTPGVRNHHVQSGTTDPLAFDPGQGRAGGPGPDVTGWLRAVGRADGNGRGARGDLRKRFGPGNQPQRVGIADGRPASRCGEGALAATGG